MAGGHTPTRLTNKIVVSALMGYIEYVFLSLHILTPFDKLAIIFSPITRHC
jgi:hypothetical protein